MRFENDKSKAFIANGKLKRETVREFPIVNKIVYSKGKNGPRITHIRLEQIMGFCESYQTSDNA